VYKSRRKQLSQNFLCNPQLIRQLVERSSIGSVDLVLEIGPGKGFITGELLRVARRVVAVELDAKLVLHLRRYFANEPRLHIASGDILAHPLPATPYKVFANIPFAIAGQIVRKLIDDENAPDDCYLVVMRELAERLSGLPHHNQFSLKHQPWFAFSLVHRFRRADFVPQPRVASVLWRIKRREQALLPEDEKARYHRFIETAFGQGQPIRQGFGAIMPRQEFRRLCAMLRIDPLSKPSYLSLDHWLAIYRHMHPLGRE
jgi:23S rRNA (adenine-N6)-dimethyltransferase